MRELDADIPHHLGLTRCNRQGTETGKESEHILQSSQTLAEVCEDGNLSLILSFLEMREAARTSILSRRWRNLWTFIPNLTFNPSNMLENDPVVPFAKMDSFTCLSSTEQDAILANRTNRFIRSVYEFLNRHQGHGVNKFVVCFYLTKEHADHLDKWVDFAIGSGANNLTLHLFDKLVPKTTPTKLYSFPFHLFDNGKGCSIESISVCYCYFTPHATFTGFSSLKSLSLSFLYLTDAQIGILLSYCFVIESLNILRCKGFVNLDIYQQSGRLNSLDVSYCPELLKIELDSIVLTFLKYTGDWPMLYMKNGARVVNATIQLGQGHIVTDSFLPRLTSDIPHLEGLSVHYDVPEEAEISIPSNSYKLTHLKKLFLDVSRSRNFDAFRLALILNAAPLLEEFHVNICGWRRALSPRCRKVHRAVMLQMFGCDESLSKLRIPDMTHMKLRQFELGGFDGWRDEVDLVSYVMRNAVALKFVLVDCTLYHHTFINGWQKASFDLQFNSAEARLDAFRQLSKIPRPSGAKLVLRQK